MMSVPNTIRRLGSIFLAVALAGIPAGVASAQTPGLVADPASLDLGPLAPGKRFEAMVRITNTSDAIIEIDQITLRTSPRLPIDLGLGCGGPLAPSETCNIFVSGVGTYVGTYRPSITVESDGPASPLVIEMRIVIAYPPPPPDTDPPTMTLPPTSQALKRGYPASRHKARFLWLWSAKDDRGVTGFVTQFRRKGIPWKTVSKRSRAVQNENHQKVQLSVPTGKAFWLRSRAYDAAGHRSKWAYSPRHRVVYRNIGPSKPGLTGPWWISKNRNAYRGDFAATRKKNATASITTVGRSISLLGRKTPKSGQIKIWVDGEFDTIISLTANKPSNLKVLYNVSWPTKGQHTVKAVASTAPPWRPTVALDAWVIIK